MESPRSPAEKQVFYIISLRASEENAAWQKFPISILQQNFAKEKQITTKIKRNTADFSEFFLFQGLFLHFNPIQNGARRKADHHPIDPKQKDNQERKRAVELLFVGEAIVQEEDRRGNQPGKRRD